jgi:hypothetical protein
VSISRPAATFALDGGGLASSAGGPLSLAQAAVRRVAVELSVDEAHDRIEIWLWRGSALEGAEPGGAITVGLGDGDATEDVLTAEVAGVEATDWGSVLIAFAPSRRLSDVHVGQSYVSQTLGAVVASLLDEGGVDAGSVDAPLSLPAVAIDPRRSVWGNLHVLARRTGHQITSDPDGAVSFGPAGATPGFGLGAVTSALGAGGGELREGAELMRFRAGPRPAVTALESATPAGSKQWYLLLAEPESASAPPVLVHPLLRTRELADAATSSAADRATRHTARARLRVPGRPDLRAGGQVDARGSTYRIRRARHLLDAAAGFVTDLSLEGTV